MPRIKLIVIEGDLSIEETARLAQALGNGAIPTLPVGAIGQEATLRTPEPLSLPAPPPIHPTAAANHLFPTASEVIQQTRALDIPEPERAPEPPPAPAPAQASASPLASARKLRDVLETLRGQGITDSAALVAECQRLRAEVPILARIAADQLDERVRRTLEGMA